MAKECKNGRSKLYVMDGAKLAKIFEKRGINARKFGKELNFHETYFPKCIRTNKIGEKAIGLLMANGIMPSQYGVGDVFEAKEKKDSEVVSSLKDISKNKCKRCALRNKETNGPSDCLTCKRCNAHDHYDQVGRKREATADTNEEEKSPVENAMNEPGVVKLEFTLDIVKLKAIIKQAVKEAYEEL